MEINSQKDFDQLIKELASEDENRVINAVKLLGEMGDLRAVEPLIRLLYSSLDKEQYNVLTYTSFALSHLKDTQVIEPLFYALAHYYAKRWYKGDEVLVSCLYALGEPALQRAIEAIESENEAVRNAGYAIILKTVQTAYWRKENIDPTLPLLLLTARGTHAHYIALQALETVEHLEEFVSDEDRKRIVKELKSSLSYTRMVALNILGRVGNAETINDLIPFAAIGRVPLYIYDGDIKAARQAIAAIKQRLYLS